MTLRSYINSPLFINHCLAPGSTRIAEFINVYNRKYTLGVVKVAGTATCWCYRFVYIVPSLDMFMASVCEARSCVAKTLPIDRPAPFAMVQLKCPRELIALNGHHPFGIAQSQSVHNANY
jgi:hypothetical protein